MYLGYKLFWVQLGHLSLSKLGQCFVYLKEKKFLLSGSVTVGLRNF